VSTSRAHQFAYKEYALPKSTARQQIIEYLVHHGPLTDPSGRATGKLRDALAYGGSQVGFTQLIATMDRAGELIREVNGKRTYRIAALGASCAESDSRADQMHVEREATQATETDYDQLAAALLVQVVQTLSTGQQPREENGAWARRRIERLERRNGELERDLSQAKAEARTVAEERDELRRQLEHSEGNLALLTDRLASGTPQKGRVADRLRPDDRELLDHLQRSTANERRERAS
jgi:chromosome segregation ATPase